MASDHGEVAGESRIEASAGSSRSWPPTSRPSRPARPLTARSGWPGIPTWAEEIAGSWTIRTDCSGSPSRYGRSRRWADE